MADETIGLDLELRLEGAQSVRELKQIIKDAKNEAVKFGEGTKEFDKFAKIAGHATDQIGDLNERIKALDPGEKAKAFEALGSTIVGGMQAATGALAVFSGDNEQLNQILLKSMAIVQGLQGLQAIADAKKQLGTIKNILGIKAEAVATGELTGAIEGQTVATTTATGASKLLRGALIATGIGALVVAVGLLVANWDKVKKALTDSFPVLNNLGQITDKIQAGLNGLWQGFVQTFKNIGEGISLLLSGNFRAAFAKMADFESIGKAVTKGYNDELQNIADDAAKKQLEKLIAHDKRKLAVMEAGGKDTYALQRKILSDELSLLDKQSEDYLNKLNEIDVLDAAHKKELLDKAKAEREKLRAEYEKQDKEVIDAKKRENELWKTLDDAREKEAKEKADQLKKDQEEMLAAQVEADKKSLDAFAKAQEDKKAKAQATQEAMFQIAQWGANGIIAIGQLMTNNAKKQEAYNKIAAGIQIGIDTARGITSAVAAAKGLTGFDYVAQVAMGVGVVLANAVKAKQLLSKTGASTPSIDTSTISSAAAGASQTAPGFQPTDQRTMLDEAERRRNSGKQESNIIKAYVVESEMTESQKRIGQLLERRKK